MDKTFSLKTEAWIIWGLVTVCYMLTSFFRAAPATLAVDIMADFAVGGGLMAVMSSAFFYPYALMQIPAGILADRWGARKTICIFLLLGGAGSLIFAQATSVGMATFGRTLVGAGMAMMFVPALRMILSWFSPRRHVSATGLLLSCGTGGMLFATWPLMMFAHYFGWRESMLVAALLTIVMSAVVWQFTRNTPEEKGYVVPWEQKKEECPDTPLRQVMVSIIKAPSYWIISTWFFCMYGVLFSFSGLWAGPYFIEGYGLDKHFAGVGLFCLAAGSTAGPAIIGYLASRYRWNKNRMLTLSCLSTMIIASPMLSPVPVIPASLLPVWALSFGIFCGGFGVIALTLIQEDFATEIVGTATGMINIYTYLGSAFMQVCAGWLVDSSGAATGLARYLPMFNLYMVMFGCAFVVSLCALRQRKAANACQS